VGGRDRNRGPSLANRHPPATVRGRPPAGLQFCSAFRDGRGVIRFAWLQFRTQPPLEPGVGGRRSSGCHGPNLIHLYDTTVAPCAVQHECPSATAAFTNTDGSLRTAPVGSSLSRARQAVG